MNARIVFIVNIFLSGVALYIFGIYGRLHWWLRSARRSGLSDPQLSTDFLNAADRLHMIAIVLALLVVVSSSVAFRTNGAGRTFGLISFVFAAIVCVLLLFVRV